jgi:hypothetical protein
MNLSRRLPMPTTFFRMTHSGGNSHVMVVKDGQLLGVVSLKDLGEYTAMKLEIESPGP